MSASTVSIWSVARRPRWIGALILALAVAAVFAALGQWQIERSIEQAAPSTVETEVSVPLDTIAQPQQPMLQVAEGQQVSLDAEFVPEPDWTMSDLLHGQWLRAVERSHEQAVGDAAE